jgi:hypothetical protein
MPASKLAAQDMRILAARASRTEIVFSLLLLIHDEQKGFG